MVAPQESWDQNRFDGGLAAQQIDTLVPMPEANTQYGYRAEVDMMTNSPASTANPADAGGLFAVQRGSMVDMPVVGQQHLGGANR